MAEQESEGTIGRMNATTLPAVSEPESWMGAPMAIGLLGDMTILMAVVIGVVALDINAAWLLATPAWHGIAIGMRARSVHADRLVAAWLSQPRLPKPHASQAPRAQGAKGWLES